MVLLVEKVAHKLVSLRILMEVVVVPVEEAVVSLVSLPVILSLLVVIQLSLPVQAVAEDTNQEVLAEAMLETTEALVAKEVVSPLVVLEPKVLTEAT